MGDSIKGGAAKATVGRPKPTTVGRATTGNFTFSPGRTANIGHAPGQGPTYAKGGGYSHKSMRVKFSKGGKKK